MIETNGVLVLSVNEQGVKLAVNGDNTHISWDSLRAACHQDDAELAGIYKGIHREATTMAADGPVLIEVCQDGTNVWWIASVRAAYGGGFANFDRRADEGGTLPNKLLASCEAEDICKRLGSRVVRRIGFDGPAAKATAARIVRGDTSR